MGARVLALSLAFVLLHGGSARAQSRRLIAVRGADRTGARDARAALQSAIDRAAAAGGGTVHLASGKYLLDSYQPSTHPWKFYNLRLPSNVTLEGDPGTVLLQGRHGRAPLPARADYVENDVVAIGTRDYQAVTFQNPRYNGGLRPAAATRAGTAQVILANRADAARFSPGDRIAIYAGDRGDVIEGETTEVRAVDRAAGTLALAHPLARSFPQAFVARVSDLATAHVTLRNLTIEGAVPLAATEVFDLAILDCRLLYDTSAGRDNIVTGMEANTIRGFRMENGAIEPTGAQYTALELPQRDSQDVQFTQVTFRAASVVFGEYAAHWKLTGNQFWIYPGPRTTAGIATGGLDVELTRNVVHSANLTAGGGSGAILSDGVGPASYMAFTGQVRYRENIIDCRADGNNCVRLTSRDPVMEGNRITAAGSACGIKIEGTAEQFVLADNQIRTGSAPALVIDVAESARAVVRGNLFSGSGPAAIVARDQAREGEGWLAQNTFAGFAARFRSIARGSRY